MTRWNVELKYQTSVDADTEPEAYEIATKEAIANPFKMFRSHCRKVKK
jgi:hypothetical protein